jgi:hypothetical protein
MISSSQRPFYLTTHNTHNRQTSIPPVGFKPTISAGERPQTYPLYSAATGTGKYYRSLKKGKKKGKRNIRKHHAPRVV